MGSRPIAMGLGGAPPMSCLRPSITPLARRLAHCGWCASSWGDWLVHHFCCPCTGGRSGGGVSLFTRRLVWHFSHPWVDRRSRGKYQKYLGDVTPSSPCYHLTRKKILATGLMGRSFVVKDVQITHRSPWLAIWLHTRRGSASLWDSCSQ